MGYFILIKYLLKVRSKLNLVKKRIGIIGSRNLACKITKWIFDSQQVEIIGGIHPPFDGWWKDEFRSTLEGCNIQIFSDLELLLEQKPDIVFSINYWKKVEASQILKVKMGIINIHHSYLLKYKGRYSTSWAILNARKLNCWEHGTTLHYIDASLDEGQIIDSWKCDIKEEDTAETLFERVEYLAFEMFKYNFIKMLSPIKVFLDPDKQSFFYDKNSNNLEIPIDSTWDEIYDFVRAWSFRDRPKPFIVHKGKRIYLSLNQ
jgi:methionyl-tRNA formyltransferase